MYRPTAHSPDFPPSSAQAVNTANVCNVKGTAAGMVIHEQTAMSTAHSATWVILRISALFCIVFPPLWEDTTVFADCQPYFAFWLTFFFRRMC